MWQLRPQLSPAIVLQIFVQDSRPTVEIEKEPSTDYVYSGALFAIDGNAKTIAMALRQMTAKFGGARNIELASAVPSGGPAIGRKSDGTDSE